MNETLNHYKLPIALSLVGVVLIAGGIFSSNLLNLKLPSQKSSFPKESIVSPKEIASSSLMVDVSGAVKTPGVYELSPTSRLQEAITEAGGFADKADKSYIAKKINLSSKLTDGQKIYIPFEGEEPQTVVLSSAAPSSAVAGVSTSSTVSSGMIGLNSATEAELDKLPGVGPVTAQKIITNRPYSDLNDLLIKKVVSKSVFEKIKPLISLE